VWARRLLAELGLARPAAVALPALPHNAAPSVQRIYAGVTLLFGCRWLGTLGDPSPLERKFMAGWCGGLPEGTVAEALLLLRRLGIVRKVGHYRRAALFLPGIERSEVTAGTRSRRGRGSRSRPLGCPTFSTCCLRRWPS
jgi:hypothetical protein